MVRITSTLLTACTFLSSNILTKIPHKSVIRSTFKLLVMSLDSKFYKASDLRFHLSPNKFWHNSIPKDPENYSAIFSLSPFKTVGSLLSFSFYSTSANSNSFFFIGLIGASSWSKCYYGGGCLFIYFYYYAGCGYFIYKIYYIYYN